MKGCGAAVRPGRSRPSHYPIPLPDPTAVHQAGGGRACSYGSPPSSGCAARTTLTLTLTLPLPLTLPLTLTLTFHPTPTPTPTPNPSQVRRSYYLRFIQFHQLHYVFFAF